MKTQRNNKLQEIKAYTRLVLTFFFLVCLSLGNDALGHLRASTSKVANLNEISGFIPVEPQIEAVNKVEVEALPFELPEDLESRKHIITVFLENNNEDVGRWLKIIEGESKFGTHLEAPTYWSKCDRSVSVKLWGWDQAPTNFIELRDYADGRVWQATCEEYGANTVETGVSKGLVHIIEPTWAEFNCTGDRMNWIDNLNCAFAIRNGGGWGRWSTN